MFCLFNESQVEPLEDNPEPTPTEPSNKTEKPETEDNDTSAEPSPFVTSDYAERQQARKDKMLDRADKASAAFEATYKRTHDLTSSPT